MPIAGRACISLVVWILAIFKESVETRLVELSVIVDSIHNAINNNGLLMDIRKAFAVICPSGTPTSSDEGTVFTGRAKI